MCSGENVVVCEIKMFKFINTVPQVKRVLLLHADQIVGASVKELRHRERETAK